MIIHSVHTGEIKVTDAPSVLEARGVGSCVAVCLYDAAKKQGGMAHVMLPEDLQHDDPVMRLKSTEDTGIATIHDAAGAIDFLVRRLARLGSIASALKAQLAGGAEMFKVWTKDPAQERLGTRNVVAVRQALQTHGIPIIYEDVGDVHGRSVRFFLEDGSLEVHTINSTHTNVT